MSIAREQFESDYIAVTLQWTPYNGVIYNATIYSVQKVRVTFIENATVHLNVTYNTSYNVSVVATRCGKNSTNITQLHYGESTAIKVIHRSLNESFIQLSVSIHTICLNSIPLWRSWATVVQH